MPDTLTCHYCLAPVSFATLRVLDVPTPAPDGQLQSVPAPHCPACARVVEVLEALGADPGRPRPAGAES